eukprot:m.14296 g.14296  ORF g.14296 m.14296 type:complete len:224 (+) comp25671_c0_seq1:66-737(+)
MSEIDEIYAAIHDYTKERDDVLSFSRGDTFKLMEKADDRWWAVKNLRTEAVGYVPASYLSNAPSRQPDKPTSPPAAAAAMNRLESDIARFAERKAPPTEAPFAPPEPNDVVQIEPRKVPHPTTSSKDHKKLHKEIQLSHKLGGIKQLGVPELQKVMDRRKPDADGKIGSITGKRREEKNLGNTELAFQLKKQSQKLHHAEKVKEKEEKKPEFMKISLKKSCPP